MREEDIFERKDYEELISFGDARFKFALSKKCKIYPYDKTIGVNLSVYFDKIMSFDYFKGHSHKRSSEDHDCCYYKNCGEELDELKGISIDEFYNGIFCGAAKDASSYSELHSIYVPTCVFNFDTNQYEYLGTFRFNMKSKCWSTGELILKSTNINDDSTIKVLFLFAFCKVFKEPYGFLMKNYKEYFNVLTNFQNYELSSRLHHYEEKGSDAEKNVNSGKNSNKEKNASEASEDWNLFI